MAKILHVERLANLSAKGFTPEIRRINEDYCHYFQYLDLNTRKPVGGGGGGQGSFDRYSHHLTKTKCVPW